MPLYTRFRETALEFISFHIVNRNDSTVRLDRNIWTICASGSLMARNIVGPYLEAIHLARTMGYNLLLSKELILTEVLQVAYSNHFARFITLANALSVRKVSSI